MKSVMAAMGITMGEIQKLPKPKILNYVGGDTDATHRVGNVLRTELLKDRQLADFYVKVLHPSSKVFERMERNGVHLDVPYYRKLQVELEVEISRLDGLMKKMIPRKLAIKYQDNFSLTRDVLMREYLFTPAGLNLKPTVFTAKTGEPSTAIDHLLTFSDVPEAKQFIDLLKESNSASKTLNTFVVGFLKHLRSDGRFHAHYRLARGEFGGGKDEGAVTGRTSCTDPALQTVPKHTKWTKRLRRALTPPEGKTILQCVHPDTKIWMANLSWKRAADLTLGEELFAFDEEAPATKHRKMRTATVDGLVLQKAKRIRLVFADGTSVICADHHKWLSFNSSQNIWRETKKLKIGDCIRRITKVYAPDRSFGAGWLSGIFDGEGWLSGRHGDGWALGVGQKEGITLDSIRAGLTARGHEFRESTNGQGVKCLRLCDTFDVFRFLQEVRPERLVAKRTWEGYALPRMGTVGASTYQSRIVAIYPAGFDTVVSIKTSTGTYVAEGLASHNCDYSQGELKITACLAEEPTMLQSYLNGVDLHAVTAAKLNGYSMDEFMLLPDDVRDDLRSGGKAGNFGLIYGMGAVGYQAYALTSYGVKLTEEEAFKQREAFFELYNRLPKWHTEFKSRAKQLGHIRSPLGRIRHLPLITSKDNEARSQAERQAVNSPVQSCLSDMMQLAMILIDREYGSQVEMFMMTHDSCAFYVPLGEEVVWAKRLKAIMDNLPLKAMFGWDHQLQFTTDAECCVPDSEGVLSFAYLKKMKGL
jgi:DNA polymerase I-like protein with 3'-5' exonuclease and polymerase domains